MPEIGRAWDVKAGISIPARPVFHPNGGLIEEARPDSDRRQALLPSERTALGSCVLCPRLLPPTRRVRNRLSRMS